MMPAAANNAAKALGTAGRAYVLTPDQGGLPGTPRDAAADQEPGNTVKSKSRMPDARSVRG